MPSKEKQQSDPLRINILQAVGDIIKTEGYTGLFIRNIARKANTSGKMIYYHFGNLDNLIETYIKEKDYWRVFTQDMESEKMMDIVQDPKALIKKILRHHFEEFDKHEEMQKVIVWEISQYSDILRKEADLREAFGEIVFKGIDPIFANSDIDFRTVAAIITAGIYYLVLHGKVNGSLFCGRDFNLQEDKELLFKTINQMVDISFELAKTKKS
ncbi:MAG: hypothetical protein DI598_00120 [Pseudopedobacter saltans]|uniref:HTH tetR-type domain-containing protein n=1 Tax=Pseudopedobacter saltans TaxID=151895 RepID=A0A2W5FCI2_9SPHI|nr:MAG: hypothetical protein DI598_00120 [Pseudopedobacter saltans]